MRRVRPRHARDHDVGLRIGRLSLWVADENRDAVQIHDRFPVILPPEGVDAFWLEYDTSDDAAVNGPMTSWNRNLVVLTDVTDPSPLLVRPPC